MPDALDTQILRDAAAFFERGEKMQLDYHVRNVQRAIGTRASSTSSASTAWMAFPRIACG